MGLNADFERRFLPTLCLLALHGGFLPFVHSAEISVARFQGALSQKTPDQQSIVIRDFKSGVVRDPEGSLFFVIDELSGCPWPEAFGGWESGVERQPQPRIVYEYAGVPNIIPLPPMSMKFPVDLTSESVWNRGEWEWKPAAGFDPSGRQITVKARERRGRRMTAVYDRQTQWLISAECDVFMGQGEQFQLTLRRSSIDLLPESDTAEWIVTRDRLLQLQTRMERRSDSTRHDLSERQLVLANEFLTQLPKRTKTFALEPLVSRIQQNIDDQNASMVQAARLRQDLVGTQLPDFDLKINGTKTIKFSDWKGKPLVLHLWAYSSRQLEEPYGQTAYFEYLRSRNASQGIQFAGIIANDVAANADQSGAVLRDAAKVAEFMNLDYPIGIASPSVPGELWSQAARKTQRPTWIVVDGSGRMTHFHEGYYEVDRRAGLKELQEAIDAVVKP